MSMEKTHFPKLNSYQHPHIVKLGKDHNNIKEYTIIAYGLSIVVATMVA
jgi:hypothetical protein